MITILLLLALHAPEATAVHDDVLLKARYTAAVQQHFGRPGNRFWPTIHKAGFTPRLFHPSEQRELLKHRCGITNVVGRATTAAAELTPSELVEGSRMLDAKVRRYRPRVL